MIAVVRVHVGLAALFIDDLRRLEGVLEVTFWSTNSVGFRPFLNEVETGVIDGFQER